MNKDALSGLVLLAIAGLYYAASGEIADSTLSDEVGADGLPRMLSILLAGLGLLLLVRSLFALWRARANATASTDGGDARLPRAIGLLLFGAAYVVVLPYLGYVVSIALLIGGIALFERAERPWAVPAIAVGGAVVYWAVFVKLLGVNQPVGSLWQGLLS